MNSEDKKKVEWYDSGHTITNLIIVCILLAIICSQAFANGGEVSFQLFTSVINHNSVYLSILIYFVLLKTYFGKRYFNYLNVFLVFLYCVVGVTSFLTLIQSFSLSTILNFTMNIVFVVYLSHTMFRDTRVWQEFHLGRSPFNELTNEWFFYAIIVLGVFLLAVNLISTVVVSGVILSIIDFGYAILFGRYIYLYHAYLDKREIDIDNEGNFDEVRGKVQEVLDKTEIDDKIIDGAKELKEKVDSFIADTELNQKMENVKDTVVDVSLELKDTVKEKVTKKTKVSDKGQTRSRKTKKGDE